MLFTALLVTSTEVAPARRSHYRWRRPGYRRLRRCRSNWRSLPASCRRFCSRRAQRKYRYCTRSHRRSRSLTSPGLIIAAVRLMPSRKKSCRRAGRGRSLIPPVSQSSNAAAKMVSKILRFIALFPPQTVLSSTTFASSPIRLSLIYGLRRKPANRACLERLERSAIAKLDAVTGNLLRLRFARSIGGIKVKRQTIGHVTASCRGQS